MDDGRSLAILLLDSVGQIN